ncbi:hypothetical protein GGS23DRAFT_597516 [Durotheca rogersii]|uniref:uncharacterized protein n=1 Tax=Durotheca rogersii TaxID=419775 RepID=UPI00221F25B5|nr:uncharacterized protein GGS23DRAFT_597516 [Durotheca rogersii]KAI5862291.1 hypothetical protein GGS23DRAFT_597516 [Durotheca rogersii]
MRKTILLCFIHGFKGGDDTFGEKSEFALRLADLVGAALPQVDVRAVTYPRYETRGDLHECVARFRDWLLNKVIDMEVANNAPSPTVDPSVHVILIGHSMGGIVAAETAIALASETPISAGGDDASTTAGLGSTADLTSHLMFPYIQGVLAFDTPYLGISPGVVAHGAEGRYQTANAALTQLSGLSNIFWTEYNKSSGAASNDNAKRPAGALPPPPEPERKKQDRRPAGGGWGWSQIAMVAGAAGALAAGGAAAAYMNRDTIGAGWGWVSSHLEFVGCLARGEELRARVGHMVRLERELGVGFANLYTRLGKGAAARQVGLVGSVIGGDRTFCNLPSAKHNAGLWRAAVNDKAWDETGAHMGMFERKENPGYHKLSEDAKDLIVRWARTDWYPSSRRGSRQPSS